MSKVNWSSLIRTVFMGGILVLLLLNLYQISNYDSLPYVLCQSVIDNNNIEHTQCRLFNPEEVYND